MTNPAGQAVSLAPLELGADEIIRTLSRLRDRIAERFPESGLSRIAAELLALARDNGSLLAYLRRPNWPIRVGVGFAIAAMLAVLGAAAATIRVPTRIGGLSEFVQGIEAAINDLVFLGVGVFFLITLEARRKRRRSLEVLHRLRSVAHIVDMHQLTKDPEYLMAPRPATTSSPARTMSAPELGRYLDYCSELLSLTSKVAVLVVQHFNDPVVLGAVNEIEALASGLSGKIWQKITLLERVTARASSTAE